MKPKTIGAVLSFLVLGFAAGYLFQSAQVPQLANAMEIVRLRAENAKYQDLQQKIGSIEGQDLEDYLRLKGLEEKYKKADDILSKITLIFLADLGIKLSDNGIRYLQNPEEFRPEGVKSATQHPSVSPNVIMRVQPGASWRQAEEGLQSLRPSDTDNFLKRAQIADFGSEVAQSSPMKQADQRISGCFSGNVQLNGGKIWQMHTEITFVDGPPLTAKSVIQLSENGKIFSNTSGDGAIRDLRTFGGGQSEAVMISAGGPTPEYFQLYPTSDQSVLIGNVYKKLDTQKFELYGTVTLDRQICL